MVVIPSRVLEKSLTGVETGNGTSKRKVEDEGTVQTTNLEYFGSNESCSSKHNPKVTGSSPVPATNQNPNCL